MASTRTIKVPDVGEGVAEVELVAWHVAVGDTVAEDQALADVMTDKASVEIPSPVAGRIEALGGEVGQTLAVGAALLRIAVDDGAGDAPPPGPAERALSPPPPPSAPSPAARAAAPPAAPDTPSAAVRAAAMAATPEAPVAPTAARPPPTAPRAPAAARAIASPALRRRAWELNVDLAGVAATGPAGRTMQADLDAHVAAHGPGPGADLGAARAARPGSRGAAPGVERDDVQAVPVIGLRRRIAVQMQESKRRIPHFSYVESVDVTEIESLRAALNARHAAARGKLTLLPLLMRAMTIALAEFPQINATFDDEAGVVTRHGAVHLGVATQTAHGLMVPVVRQAQARDPWALAADVARLADAARAGRATRDELRGSTITISSLGALGGIASTPVINRPEVAIVAVNRIVEQPVVRGGAVVVRSTMNLSSSFDHRVVDGMDAARFVQALRSLLEQPALLFVDA